MLNIELYGRILSGPAFTNGKLFILMSMVVVSEKQPTESVKIAV